MQWADTETCVNDMQASKYEFNPEPHYSPLPGLKSDGLTQTLTLPVTLCVCFWVSKVGVRVKVLSVAVTRHGD